MSNIEYPANFTLPYATSIEGVVFGWKTIWAIALAKGKSITLIEI